VSDLVLDAAAVLAVVLEERGADAIRFAVAEANVAAISAVNLSEIAAKLHDAGASHLIAAGLSALDLTVVAFDGADALAAGALRPATRPAGLSLGDRACLALAMRLDAPAITTDRAWAGLGLPVEVIVAR
jgi:PIN domain nuclease of toxin-antitoxin system